MTLRVWLLSFCLSFSAFADNVVVIGDSHSCGAFGYRMFNNLLGQGHRVHLYCMESSSPKHWIEGSRPKNKICQEMTHTRLTPCDGTGEPPNIGEILSRNPDAKIIVALGTNSLYGKTAGVYYQEMVNTIREAGRSCHWIGPPNLQPSGHSDVIGDMQDNLPSFYSSLESVVEPTCALTDSRPATAPGTQGAATGDGVHRTQAAGRSWADQVTPHVSGGRPSVQMDVPGLGEMIPGAVLKEPADQPVFDENVQDGIENGFFFGGGAK